MQDRFITAAIINIGAQGDGLATHHGKPVYVAKTAPGDTANFALGKPRAEGYAATLQRIITPSPHRQEPPCPYFSRCGGCALQHVTDEFYRDWKITKVKHALQRADVKVETFEEPIFLPHATRRRTTFVVTPRGLGYNEARSHNIVDVKQCIVLEPELDAVMQGLRPYLADILGDQKTCDITLQHADGAFDMVITGKLQKRGRFTYNQDAAFGEILEKLNISRLSYREKDFIPPEVILARKPVLKKFGALTVVLPPAAFLQASRLGEDALVGAVLSGLNGAKNVADLFSGCGTFSGHMLQAGASVSAFDGDKGAIDALSLTKYPKLTATRRDLFKSPLEETELAAFDAVVFDPPRAGAKEQAEKLAYSDVKTIVGVSCSPTTFARDAAILQEGGYKLKSLTLIDQFVWSAHMEVAGLFVRA